MTAIVTSRSNMLARAKPLLQRLSLHPKPILVEVGVSTGLLAEYLLRVRGDLIWHGIDPWLGREDLPPAYIATGDSHAALDREAAERNMTIARKKLAPFGSRATIHRAMSPEAAAGFADGSLDLVFCDGDHSYDGTLADLRVWWPKLKPSGWLGGHDLRNPDRRFRFGVDKAVEAFGKEISKEPELDLGLTYWFSRQ